MAKVVSHFVFDLLFVILGLSYLYTQLCTYVALHFADIVANIRSVLLPDTTNTLSQHSAGHAVQTF